MNWQKIINESPLAFKALMFPMAPPKLREIFEQCSLIEEPQTKEKFYGSAIMKAVMPLPYHRILYDFFDSKMIFVVCGVMDAEVVLVKDGKAVKSKETTLQNKRVLTEYAAFEIAFQFLEEELKLKMAEQK